MTLSLSEDQNDSNDKDRSDSKSLREKQDIKGSSCLMMPLRNIKEGNAISSFSKAKTSTYERRNIDAIQKRYIRQSSHSIFDLSHSLSGKHKLQTLAFFLEKENHSIEQLKLDNNAMNDSDLKTLAKGLQNGAKSIHTLSLSHNRLTNHAIEILLPFLKAKFDSLYESVFQ